VSDSPALWLWLDVESTGLLDSRPAVLEAAWMITDGKLGQLTPLRQRLCAIPCAPTRWERLTSWLRPDPLREWPSRLMSDGVLKMHIRSGLDADWKTAEKIRDVQDLDMAIHEDHLAALQLLDPDGADEVPLYLAGAGVAQFEARLLPMIGSIYPTQLHYRAADVSVARMVAGLPKTVTSWSEADGLQIDPQPGVDELRAFGNEHRAAADVQAAYAAARDLRARLQAPEVAVTYQWSGESAP
jgi:oligoribonuclease (3'-5' exoribonuclease)